MLTDEKKKKIADATENNTPRKNSFSCGKNIKEKESKGKEKKEKKEKKIKRKKRKG